LLPGAASGRDVVAPPGWPVGRIVGVGYGGVAVLSDDGGDSYRAPGYLAFGRDVNSVVLVRRPDSHPLGPGPRLIGVGQGEAASASVWLSDDAGETWVRRAYLPEPVTGPGAPTARGLHALPEPGEADPGAGGRAIAVLGLGHIYQTTDAGDSWSVIGRAPEMNPPSDTLAPTFVEATALGPDGRLYVSVARVGPRRGWLWRTTDPFIVASSEAPTPPASGLSLVVYPNPSRGSVTLTVRSAQAVRARVEVMDAAGRRVSSVEVWATPGGTAVPLATSTWAAGVYVARASDGPHKEAVTARFTVVR
jgi:hypothetical protein